MNQDSYKVLIYPTAESDLREIKDYFQNTLQTSADKLFSKFYKDIELLESFPFSFPLVRDPYLSSLGYRMIPVDNFLVFYVVKDKEVQVHRFIYGKRNYLNLLK
jgi:toxin ParE1/3/4